MKLLDVPGGIPPQTPADCGRGDALSDGVVNIRDEGWCELEVGAVFDLETRLERHSQTQELDEMAHGVNVHYTAVLGTKEMFTLALWALAVERDVPTAKERAVIGDGAAWIWNVADIWGVFTTSLHAWTSETVLI